MSATADLISRLADTGYKSEDIPGDHDFEIAESVSSINSPEQFAEVTQTLSLRTARVLLAFAYRAASYAVRVNDPNWVRNGLIAAQLTLAQEDTREVLVIYSLLYRSLELLAVDPNAMFQDVAERAGGKFGDVTREFAKRNEHDKSISAMGYAEGADETGFKFICTW